MAKDIVTSGGGSGKPPTKTGPLTAETYESAAASWIKAIGRCEMLDPRNPDDNREWAAWRQFFHRLNHRSASTMKKVEKGRWNYDKFAVPTRFPWELTGEAPFEPSPSFYPSLTRTPNISPQRRRELVAALRRAGGGTREAAE